MCRLLGSVSSTVTDYRSSLAEAPRSLAALSPDHPHGWGLAVHDGRSEWDLYRSPECARDDSRFHAVSRFARGRVLIAHVRNRTVGPKSLQNTHPFRRDAWVFAHNGTLRDLSFIEKRTSSARRRQVEGDTDSERLFAYLLTAIDEVGGAKGVRRGSTVEVDKAVSGAVSAALAHPEIGAINFLLSDGDVMYAHRYGRTLFVLDHAAVPPETRRTSPAVMIASERVTDEPWTEVPERTLLRVDGGAAPRVTTLAGPRSPMRVRSYRPATLAP